MISQLGVGPALVQRRRITDEHVATGFTLSMLVGVLLAGLLFVVAPIAADYYGQPSLVKVLRVVGLAFLLSSGSTVSLSLLQRHLAFRRYVIITALSYAVGYCAVSIAMTITGFGIWALVGGVVGEAVVKLVLGFLLCPHKLGIRCSASETRELLRFGGGVHACAGL